MTRLIPQSYKHFYSYLQNTHIIICAILLCIFINIPSSWADSYTVEDIKVDVSASNAVQAREKAFEEAQIKGYKMLAERFLSNEELENFTTPDINTVAIFVKDFEVTNEKLSATRYAGTYKIRYSPKAFANRKTNTADSTNDAAQAKAPPKKGTILIIPFFEEAGYPALWRTNPFMQAWLNARDNNNAAPAIVPLGDAQDIAAIRDSEGLRYDPQKLLILKNRYRAPQAAILVATPELMPDGTQNIAVAIYQAKSYGPELSRQISVKGQVGEGRDQLYGRVIAEINKVFNQTWKRPTAVAGNNQTQQPEQRPPLTGPINSLVAQVSFNSMRSWVEAKRAMERSYGIRSVNVKSLSPVNATVMIDYQGSIESLRQNLAQNGIGMNDPLTQGAQFGGSATVYQLTTRR